MFGMADTASPSFVEEARTEEFKFKFQYDHSKNSFTVSALQFSTGKVYMKIFEAKISYDREKIREVIIDGFEFAERISMGKTVLDVSFGFMIFTLEIRILTDEEKLVEFEELMRMNILLERRVGALEKRTTGEGAEGEGEVKGVKRVDSLSLLAHNSIKIPSPESQKDAMLALAKARGETKEGDIWCLVDSNWWSHWESYTGVSIFSFYFSVLF